MHVQNCCFANETNCFFTFPLPSPSSDLKVPNDAFRKTLLKVAKKTLRQPTTRAEFSLTRALISN